MFYGDCEIKYIVNGVKHKIFTDNYHYTFNDDLEVYIYSDNNNKIILTNISINPKKEIKIIDIIFKETIEYDIKKYITNTKDNNINFYIPQEKKLWFKNYVYKIESCDYFCFIDNKDNTFLIGVIDNKFERTEHEILVSKKLITTHINLQDSDIITPLNIEVIRLKGAKDNIVEKYKSGNL